ncbi:hypothetical protein [Xenorhabdus bovienii]|uniref:hypothetical protein n=1 Tax=Xenorhabdus bovienii TaxID=40576 RepID=UPI0030B8F805
MYIKATCPVPKTTAPSGIDDAATARTTDIAVRKLLGTQKTNCHHRANDTGVAGIC